MKHTAFNPLSATPLGRPLKQLTLALCMLGFAAQAMALNTEWVDGGTAGDWFSANNWSLGVPGSNDVAILGYGTANLNADATIQGLNQSGGASKLTGTGNLTLTGASTWSGGSQTGSGTTNYNDSLSIAGDGMKSLGRVINAVDTTWSGNSYIYGGDLDLGTTGVFNNTGVFTENQAFDNRINGVSGAFNNLGTYNKQSNTLTLVQSKFNNNGTVNVNAGTLRLQNGGTHGGTFHLATGTVLNMNGGTHNLSADAVTGEGSFQVTYGTVNLNGGTLNTDFLLAGGATVLSGIGHSINGTTTWTGGAISGTGTTNFNGPLALSGNGQKQVSGGRVVNASNTVWSGNTANDYGTLDLTSLSSFNNTGTYTDTNAFNNRITGSGTFNNLGTYNKQTNTLTLVLSKFDNSGTVNVNAGTLKINTALTNMGTVSIASGATFRSDCAGGGCFVNAGIIQGKGTLITPSSGLVNNGQLSPGLSVGHLTIDGNLQETVSAAINFELASIADFDLLTVTGDVTLGGDLSLWNAGYNPVVGDSFVLMGFNQRLGGSEFDSVTLHGFGTGVSFDVLYNADNVTVQVTAVPEPEVYAFMLAGLGLIGWQVRRRS